MPIIPFALATLIPALALGIGGLFGSTLWLSIALIYMTIFTFSMDFLGIGDGETNTKETHHRSLSVALAILHFGLLGLGVSTVSSGNALQGAIGFFAFGLFFGQVSNSNAHELIHRPSRLLHWLGAWIFISHLFGHHTSAHRLVHHTHVATDRDPNSAPKGMSFYSFYRQACRGSFWAGLAAEKQRATRMNPYLIYTTGAAIFLALAWVIAGVSGVIAYVLLANYASMQILLSDYVQHYGLRRHLLENGKPEPVSSQHSWDSPHRFSGLLMLNAPRHSDHHAHPARPYPSLEFPENGPKLPYSLPVMGAIAWFPTTWRRLMDPRLDRVKQGRGDEVKP